MKKLLFIIAMLLPAFAFANNDVKTKNEVKAEKTQEVSDDVIIYATISINSNSITLPYTITAPAPPLGTIVSVSGPCNANMTDWTIQNGNLSITYSVELDIRCLRDPGTYYIETPTLYEGTLMKYKIEVVSK